MTLWKNFSLEGKLHARLTVLRELLRDETNRNISFSDTMRFLFKLWDGLTKAEKIKRVEGI